MKKITIAFTILNGEISKYLMLRSGAKKRVPIITPLVNNGFLEVLANVIRKEKVIKTIYNLKEI